MSDAKDARYYMLSAMGVDVIKGAEPFEHKFNQDGPAPIHSGMDMAIEGGDISITLKVSVENATRAFRQLSRMISSAYTAGYYIENRRGRNRLVPFKQPRPRIRGHKIKTIILDEYDA